MHRFRDFKLRHAFCGLAAFLLPCALAYAHTGTGAAAGFASGFVHPFTGLDHALVPVAAGLWAAQRGGRGIIPLSFLFPFVVALGIAAGAPGLSFPYQEEIGLIALAVLGALVASAVRLPLIPAFLILATFAFVQGYTHGVNIPSTVSGFAFGTGAVFGTAVLHTLAIALSLLARSPGETRLVRATGASIAISPTFIWLAA